MPKKSVEWSISRDLVSYPDAIAAMEARVDAIRKDKAAEAVWLLEHPSVYTAGTSAQDQDLLAPDLFPTYRTGRGGQYTYHGPGQRVAYVMLDLQRRQSDVRAYVRNLEQWLIISLAGLGVVGTRREGRVGIWINRDNGREDKIAAIGVRIRRWVTYHGISLNVAPDLAHFNGIVPCGVQGHGVTSLLDLGVSASMATADSTLRNAFENIFFVTTFEGDSPFS
jgi:lipoyl(octanoyl) transferase